MLKWILGFSLLGSVGGVAGAAFLLTVPEKARKRLVPWFVSYAVGTLMATAFLGLIPHALEHAAPTRVMAAALTGMVLFFVLEKFVLWRHCHQRDCQVHQAAGLLILLGDALHNFVDGVVMAAAFLTSIPLGIATAFAAIAHELPQEVGDFAILLESGYSRRQAFTFNLASGLATLPGAIIAYLSLSVAEAAVPYVLALSAAGFLYVATADLIPSLHERALPTSGLRQMLLLLAGIGTILLFQARH